MHVSFRLAELLESKHKGGKKRGRINEIANETGIERHTVKAMMDNKAKYISLDAVGKLCFYLINTVGVDAKELPGALFGRDPESFWPMLAQSRQLEFVLGTRTSEGDLPQAEYVTASDSRLQAVMMTSLADWRAKDLAKKDSQANVPHSLLPIFELVKAPPGKIKPDDQSKPWTEVCERAREVFQGQGHSKAPAQIAIGSVKVNPVFELMMADVFHTEPFRSQDTVAAPRVRSCPIMFRYRDTDPQPPSCIGGLRLSKNVGAEIPGVYYEVANGKWDWCACNERTEDVAFVFYAYRPNDTRLHIACGGFSSRSTDLLTNHLVAITDELGAPTYKSDDLKLGLYVIPFELETPKPPRATVRDAGTPKQKDVAKRTAGLGKFKWRVIPVPPETLERRLGKQRPDEE